MESYILIECGAIIALLHCTNVTFKHGFQIPDMCFLFYCPKEFNGVRHAIS
jgi:hypothetical protein